jgi:hypothetical protein
MVSLVERHEYGADVDGSRMANRGHCMARDRYSTIRAEQRRSRLWTFILQFRSDDYPIIERAVAAALTPWWPIFALVNLIFFGVLVVAKTARMAGVSWPQALPLIRYRMIPQGQSR